MADDSGGEVVVRLSQEGGDEVVRQLQEIITKLGEVSEASKRTAEQGEKAGSALSTIATATTITAVAEFGERIFGAAEKVAHYAEMLIEARSEQEQFLIRMASLDEKTQGWSGALATASNNLHELAGMSENLTFDQLVGVFQKLKLLVGGTNESLLDLTQRMVLFAEKAGVGADQMLRVIQMAERTGTLPMRGDMANASLALKEAGITGDDIRQAAQEGGKAMDELMQKVQVSKEASETLRHSWVNLKNDFSSAADIAKMTVGAGFDPLKTSLENLTEAIEKNGAGWETLRDQIATAMVSLKELVAPGGEDAAVSYWQKVLSGLLMLFTDWLTAWKAILSVMVEAISTGVDVIQSIIKNPFNVDEHVARLKDGLNSAVEIAKEVGRKFRDAWDEASGTGDTGPSHHATPEEDDAANGFRAPIGPDDIKQIKAATDALQEMYDRADRQHQLAGLTGITKELQQIQNAAEDADEQMTKAYNRAIDEGWKPSKKDSDLFDAKQARIYADAVIDQAFRVAEAHEKATDERIQDERKYVSLVQSLEAGLTDDVIARNNEAAEREKRRVQEQIDDYERMMIRKHALDADMEDKVAAVKTAGAKKIADIDARTAEKNAELIHVQDGDWTAYYDDLMRKASNAQQNMFVAAQESGRKVAGEMAKAAQTAGDGWDAGLAAIHAKLTSFGQDVTTLMTGVWSSLTNAFEEGFYDILSGKFDSLKDVLKSLWDSILKDFSKMLAQMLERWLLTGDAMGNGQGGGGGFSSILGLLGGGRSGSTEAVYTPGGTNANAPGGGFTQYGDYIGTTGYGSGSGGGGGAGGGALTGANLGALAAYGYGLYQGIGSIFQKNTTSTPTYQGQSLGQTADFGGPGGGAALTGAVTVALAAATATLATAAATGVALTAAAAATVPVIGWIAAAVLLIVAVLMTIFSGQQEGHVYVTMADAFEKAGARSAIGNFVAQVVDSTATFVGNLALKAAGPDSVAKYVAAYQKSFKDIYGGARFDFAAGSPEDLQKGVEDFFKKTLPTMAMRAAFGQIGYDPNGNRDAQGGLGGMDWNLNNSQYMDRDGNWVKKQLYDPNAPIPAMLTGLGFTADEITEIANRLAGGVDIETFKKYLTDLVGVVVDLGELAKQFGRTTAEWFDFIHKAQSEKGTAAEFTTALANLKAQGSLLETIFGDDRVAAAKQLVTDSASLLNNMAQALASILSMIDQIKEQTAASVRSYGEKLMTPAEREAAARVRFDSNVAAIGAGKNPDEVMAAWKLAMQDFATVLDAIVSRINAIKALQQSYADFRTQMGKDAGPQFGTDPQGWLRQNQSEIDAVKTTLLTASGDEAIQGAQTLLQLTQERYANEMSAIRQIDSLIKSINTQTQNTIDNLTMQAMGSVDPTTGQWKQDVHAQGDYLKQRYNDLMTQLTSATSAEEVSSIMSQINSIISQLASQPQDPSHYAESRQILIQMARDAQKASTTVLATLKTGLENDLKGIGDTLKAGETALATALGKAQGDFTSTMTKMTAASTTATTALTHFADGLTLAMNQLTEEIRHWIWVMTHPDGEEDPNYRAGGGVQASPPATGGREKDPNWEDDPDDPNYEVNIVTGRRRKKKKITGDTNEVPTTEKSSKAGTSGSSDINVTVTINGGSPEEIATAAAAATYDQTLVLLRQQTRETVRIIRNNPGLISTAS